MYGLSILHELKAVTTFLGPPHLAGLNGGGVLGGGELTPQNKERFDSMGDPTLLD